MHTLKWFPKQHAEAMPVSESGRSREYGQSNVKHALCLSLLAISALWLTRGAQPKRPIRRRHYRIDENGERVYYSAEEIDRERAEAKKQMDEFCTPLRVGLTGLGVGR